MERLRNCEFIIDIEMIENISGADQYFEVIFSTTDKKKHKFIFKFVWDMRYAIENASIDRFCEFRKRLPEGIIDNGVYVVEDSDYIKYFEHQVSLTRPVDELTHYILCDRVDTTLDILVCKNKPVLVPLDS